ncbi:MAG: metal ABC transporter substrate-binding protein [Candidatus Eremiobacteraeota bacterium]|nr:metal ABC transporter substrate-binding protein [Candidatus Eremiobacteraeota bacterium]
MLAILALVAVAFWAASCTSADRTQNVTTKSLKILVTISTFETFARAVAGDRATVDSLVPVGASPEDYQPSPTDIEKIHSADILIENGLGLETWLARTIDNAKNDGLDIVVATDGLPAKNGNPHLWMDPVLARGYVRAIRAALVRRDPAGRATYEKNAAAYDSTLVRLRSDIATQIETIPKRSRAMLVFHNAWQYYDDRFGLRTVGVLELSPGQEPDPQYVAHLVSLAKANGVRAVFAEPEYSPKLVQALAESAGIKTVENLFDDSLGTNEQTSDYGRMLRYDTATIVRALSS